ncbi:MAG TPA: hypothetical protein VGO66_00245 [Solirubrobacterales bacterium]|nr:hypothetical protein [Solirubrobacterales bacterium]
MSLVLGLKELWRRRAYVVAAVLAAAGISILVVFQVSLLPPSISKRAQVEVQGSIDVLVDSAASPIADARRDLAGLTARAGVFARLMAGGNVVGRIAQDADVPIKQIDVAGPEPLPGEAPGAEQPSSQARPYGIAITQQGELPILSIVTRAPTRPEARALAAAAPAAIAEVVTSTQRRQGTPSAKRVQFRVLGPAEVVSVNNSPGRKMALLLFVVLLGIFVALVLAAPRFLAAWRTAEPEPAPEEPPGEPEAQPMVLLLPTSARRGDQWNRHGS